MKVLVAEIWPVHEECLPAWVHAFNALGIRPDVLLNKKMLNTKGSPFECYNGIELGTVYEWSPLLEEFYVELINRSDYDLVIANSFQSPSQKFYARLKSNIVGFIHHYPELNIAELDLFNVCRAFPSDGSSSSKPWLLPVVLWDFVCDFAVRDHSLDERIRSSIRFFYPLTPPHLHRSKKSFGEGCEDEYFRLCIPGGINFNNRDYPLIVNALSGQEVDGVKLVVPGGGKVDQIEKFVQLTSSINNMLELNVEVESHENGQGEFRVPYDNYFRSMARSDMIVPLIRNNSRYLSRSITSSVSSAISLGIPICLPFVQASLYGLGFSFGVDTHSAVSEAIMLSKMNFDEKVRHMQYLQRLNASFAASKILCNINLLGDILNGLD